MEGMGELLMIPIALALTYWLVGANWLGWVLGGESQRARNAITVLVMIIGLLLAFILDRYYGLGEPLY